MTIERDYTEQGKEARIVRKDAYENIANAIIQRACYDYANAIVNNKNGTVRECENFFKSHYGEILTEANLIAIQDKVKASAKRFSEIAKEGLKDIDNLTKKPSDESFAKCPICNGNIAKRWKILTLHLGGSVIPEHWYCEIGLQLRCSRCQTKKNKVVFVLTDNALNYRDEIKKKPIYSDEIYVCSTKKDYINAVKEIKKKQKEKKSNEGLE